MTALVILILIIVAIAAVIRDRKKRTGKAELKSTNPDLINRYKLSYCILRGQIKGFNSSITTILCQVGSYRTVVG